jgi:hypothetical protein
MAALPLGLLWTQLHGGNPSGVLLLALLLVARPAAHRAAVVVVAAALTCAGPYGWRVHEHFLGARPTLAAIREWQSIASACHQAGAPAG